MFRSKNRKISARLSAVFLTLLIILSSLVFRLGSDIAEVEAASASLTGSESITVHLKDSNWQGSKIRVRFLNSGGTELRSREVNPTGNKVTVTGVSNAAKLVVEKLNSSKNTLLTAMKNVISGNSTSDVVFYDNSAYNWSTPMAYAWKGSTNNGWNTSATHMTQASGTMYYKAFTAGEYEKVIFNKGNSTNQTANLTLTPATAASPKYYDHKQNKWVTYTDVDRSVTVNVSDRYGDDLNDLYMTSKTSAKWSKYNANTPTTTVYFKPSSNWSSVYVHYDDDDDEPFDASVQMTLANSDPAIYQAQVYLGAMVSFSNAQELSNSTKIDSGSVFADRDEPVFVAATRNWTTLEDAKIKNERPVDMTITNNNFNNVSGLTVVGFDATYYDYYSNNERTQGWKQGLVDDNFSDGYRKQFSNLNDEIIDIAKTAANYNWRYPLVFGDDNTADFFINGYYDTIKSTRSPSIDKARFQAANNSNFLGGPDRSVLGLVKPKLINSDLYVTDTLKAPYFDNEWLKETSTSDKEVLYIIDNNNYGKDGIYANFWVGSDVLKDIHPEQVTDTAVAISGVSGKIYRYVVDKKYTSVQLSHSTNYGSKFYEYMANGTQYVLSNETGVVKTSGNTVSSSTYKSGIQQVEGSPRAKIIGSKFPFVETTDAATGVKSYVFDSKGSTRYDNIKFNWDDNKVEYYSGDGVTNKLLKKANGTYENGFFPMNQPTDNTRNYGFGMRVDMDFTLPMNGMLTSTKSAKFEYSGDDDVWVFIDNQLVLDIGGAHKPTTGSIDFGAGTNLATATTNTVYGEFNSTEKTTTVYEFVMNKSLVDGKGFLEKWSGGQYPGSGSIAWSSLSGKAFYTSGKVDSVADNNFASYDDASGKRHIFVVNDGNKSDVAIYATDNVLGNWGDCTPGNSTYTSKVTINTKTMRETISLTDTDKNGASVSKQFAINNTDPTKKHHMTVFYMERGTNDSNLKIEFSMQPVMNELHVYKEVEIDDINEKLETEVENTAKTTDFGYSLTNAGTLYGSDKTGGKDYTFVYADDTKEVRKITNGTFTLQNYDAAVFSNDNDLKYGNNIVLNETQTAPYSYDTEVTLKDIISGETIQTFNSKNTSFQLKNSQQDENERTALIAEYTNKLKTAPINLSKTLLKADNTASTDDPAVFEFQLLLDVNNDGTPEAHDIAYAYSSDPGTTYIAENGVVHMRADQQIIFPDIPVGMKYKITESAKAGYTITVNDNNVKTVAASGNNVSYTNKTIIQSANLSAFKKLDNAAYANGNLFSFKAELLKRIKNPTETVTTGMEAIYATNTKSTTDADGKVEFDAFNITASLENIGDYIFKITELPDNTKPMYNFDSTVYYAKINVSANNVAAPVYYTDEACTTFVGTDGSTAPTFENTTKKGSITVNKTDVNGDPVAGTQFMLIRVKSEADVDALLTPAVINALPDTHTTKVSTTLDTNTNKATAKFDDLELYRSVGMFQSNGSGGLEWASAVTETEKQVYCIFEYSPTSGYNPNYSKKYVVLADETNPEYTFGVVDTKAILPNSSGEGTLGFTIWGLGIIGTGALLSAAYGLRRKLRPVYRCRHTK